MTRTRTWTVCRQPVPSRDAERRWDHGTSSVISVRQDTPSGPQRTAAIGLIPAALGVAARDRAGGRRSTSGVRVIGLS